MPLSRKDFIINSFWASSGFIILNRTETVAGTLTGNGPIKVIVADYDRCTGCRTCETICSAFKTDTSGDKSPHGPGNCEQSNIRVWRFMPPVDIPVTCYLCHDMPCVASCPVSVSAETGRKALYRDESTGTIVCDLNRCIGCQSCAETCKTERSGVIYPDPEGSPTGMCNLCDGQPQCVAWCPYEALSFVEIWPEQTKYSTPEIIFEQLKHKLYTIQSH